MTQTVNIDDEDVGKIGAKPILLVIGKDIGFSDELIQYAIDLSTRMNYEILAVNIYQYNIIRKFFSADIIKIASEDLIKSQRDKGVAIFKARASNQNIKFESKVVVAELDQFLQDIVSERDDIDLVTIEPSYVQENNEISDNPISSIPTFTIVPME
ncbi:MAG: hypothetical protein ACN4E2_02015 [Nitrospinota bacterium]